MKPSSADALNRRVLSRIDSKLLSELDEEKGEWLVKVPASPAVRAVWKRYCEMIGIPMGHALAVLLHHELASVVDEDFEALSDRLKAKEADLDARGGELKAREQELSERSRAVARREAEVGDREAEAAEREHNVAVIEHNLAQQLLGPQRPETPGPRLKVGRNEPCWCGSGKKYKVCHLGLD